MDPQWLRAYPINLKRRSLMENHNVRFVNAMPLEKGLVLEHNHDKRIAVIWDTARIRTLTHRDLERIRSLVNSKPLLLIRLGHVFLQTFRIHRFRIR